MLQTCLNVVRGTMSTLLILPVRFYQIAIGPLLPKVCRYYPSCSEFIRQWKTHLQRLRRI